MFCKHCKNLMKEVMRFEDGKAYKLYKCPVCYLETKPKRFTFDDKQISRNNIINYKSREPIKRKEVGKCIALI